MALWLRALVSTLLTASSVLPPPPPTSTHPGKAVFLARDKHHLSDLCHLIRHDAPYLFQEYVKESHGRDVRVVLVGGRVIGSMQRCSTDGRMQSNCSLGRYTHTQPALWVGTHTLTARSLGRYTHTQPALWVGTHTLRARSLGRYTHTHTHRPLHG